MSASHRAESPRQTRPRSFLIPAPLHRFSIGRPFVRGPLALWTLLALGCALAGCGTTTKRVATEQLLLSDAVDTAINKIDFSHLSGRSVYLDTTYLRPIRGIAFVNADYIISSLRQQLIAARCNLMENRDQADVIVEPRVGALGNDGHEIVYGIPKQQTGQLSSAAAALGSTPILPPLPELSIAKVEAQQGIAKILVFAYERETRQPIWQSGVAKSESTARNAWLFGAGPFEKGTIYEGTRFAGRQLGSQDPDSVPASTVPLTAEHLFQTNPWIGETRTATVPSEPPK